MENLVGVSEWEVLIIDVFVVHICHEVLSAIKAEFPWWLVRFVPAACTGEFQPLDISFNHTCKMATATAFCAWAAASIPATGRVDLRLSSLKPAMPLWLLAGLNEVSVEQDKMGWEKAGLLR